MKTPSSYRPAPQLRHATLALLLASAPLAARAADVWVASASDKIAPTLAGAPAGAPKAASISAAKNEFEAFQIAITGAATGVSVATPAVLTGPGGAQVPLRFFREAIIQIATRSSLDGGTGPYHDALVPDVDDVVGEKRNAFPFDVPAGQTRVVWAEAHVPTDAPAGIYSGTVTVRGVGGDVAVPVTLNVWDFALPSTSSLRTHYGVFYPDLLQGHGVGYDTVNFPALRYRYSQLGLDHRISLGLIDDGSFDLGHFEQVYGSLMNGTAPTQLEGAQLTSVMFRYSSSQGTRTAVASNWATFFKARGWFDRLFDYTCDEPPNNCAWSSIAPRAKEIHAADPSFRTLVTSNITEASAAGVTSSVDILVPIIQDLYDRPGSAQAGPQRAKYDAFVAPGGPKEVWTYQSCTSQGCGANDSTYAVGWPSVMIDALSIRARMLEWLSFLYDVSGELYWDATWAFANGMGDPWNNQYTYGGNGDGTLFYPGTPAKIGGATHIPVASIRLKMIREGMEDYEYLKLLADAGDPQLARDLATALFPNAWTPPTVSNLLATRETIARRIVELLHPSAPPPAAAPPPTGVDPGQEPPPVVPVTGNVTGSPVLARITGSGCSAGVATEVFAALGLLGAVALRRRRRRS